MRCGSCKGDHAKVADVKRCYGRDGSLTVSGSGEVAVRRDREAVAWYCNHDVPNGCHDCASLRREELMLDSMTDAERQTYLYGDGGTFETYFARGGPAWQKEEMERMGLR